MLCMVWCLLPISGARAGTIDVQSFNLTPQSVDTSAASDHVTLSLHIQSTTAVDNVFVRVSPPSPYDPWQRVYAGNMSNPVAPSSGTTTDGIWDLDVELPRFAAQGEWNVTQVYVHNTGGDAVTLDTPALMLDGFDTSFDQAAVGDTTEPSLNDLTLSTTTVNVSGVGAAISINAVIEDDSGNWDVFLSSLFDPLDYSALSLMSGSAVAFAGDGIAGRESVVVISPTLRQLSEQYEIPANTRCGTYAISVRPYDGYGNRANLSGATLSAQAFPTTVTVANPTNCSSTGTSGNDTFIGSQIAERFAGLGGLDTIKGAGGNDVLNAGDDADIVNGGDGADVIDGDRGDDRISGGRGADRIRAGAGNDVIRVNDSSRDKVNCGRGYDVVYGNRKDRIASNCEMFFRIRDGRSNNSSVYQEFQNAVTSLHGSGWSAWSEE